MKIKSYGLRWCLVLLSAYFLAACESDSALKTPGVYNTASSEGLRIRYEVAGQGDTSLVFIHCWSCNRSFWDAQFEAFSHRYRVVRLDLVGHGESEQERRGHTMAKFGSDVAFVVDELDLQRVILIGHSMGGPVAVEAAKILKERALGVVGVDVFHTAFEYPVEESAIAAFVKPFEDDFTAATTGMVQNMFTPAADPALVGHVSDTLSQADRQTAIEAMYDIFRWSRDHGADSLKALGARLRNINGDPTGSAVPTDPSVILVAGAGHFPHMENPKAFNAALQKILNELDQR